MAIILRIALVLALCLCIPTGAFAQDGRKLALIVTNKDYPATIGALGNTHTDGERMARTLRRLGFEVVHKRDLDKAQMLTEVSAYVARLTEAGRNAVGFFYYAGHGAANSKYGENYLIPVAAPVKLDSQLVLFGVKAGEVIDAIAATPARANFVVLDSCRNIPLEYAVRSGERGLRREPQRKGMLVAFATDPGKVATDSGVYAAALADELEKPGVEALQIFRAVRRRVLDATNEEQFPWMDDGIVDDFYFVAAAVASAPVKPDDRPAGQPVAIKPVDTPKPEPRDAYAPRQLVRTFTGHKGPVLGAAFSGDGRSAYSVGEHGVVRTWDVATGAEMRVFTPPLDFHFNGDAVSVAFSRDGRYLLLGGATADKFSVLEAEPRVAGSEEAPKIRLLMIDLVRDEVVPLPIASKSKQPVESVALSADGRFAVVATKQYSIYNGPQTSPKNTEDLFARVDSMGPKYIDELSIFDIAYGQQFRTLETIGPVRDVVAKYGLLAFSPDGRKIVASTADAIKIFDAATAKLATAISLKKLSDGCGKQRGVSLAINSISFSPDGKLVAGALNCHQYLSARDRLGLGMNQETPIVDQETPIVETVVVNPFTLKFWDTSTGKDIGDGERFGDITQAAFAPQGRFVALGDKTGQNYIFNTQTRIFARLDNRPAVQSETDKRVTALAFSPDGRFLLSGSADKTLKLWDVSEWTQPQEARR